MYYITLDNDTSLAMGLQVTRRPNFPAPSKNYKEYDIEGYDGLVYEDLETFDDIVIEIEMNYINNPNLWHEQWRKVKKWALINKPKKLIVSDNPEYYYLVKKIELSQNEREVIEGGTFTILVTCEAYNYLITGELDYDYDTVLYNMYENTKPIYIIEGEGICHLNVNGTDCTCNVGQNLTINTYLGISYRNNGLLENTAINADYSKLALLNGENSITITNGFKLKIIPNWRCL